MPEIDDHSEDIYNDVDGVQDEDNLSETEAILEALDQNDDNNVLSSDMNTL